MQVLQQMLIFVIIMVVGAWARKKNILTPDNQGQITQLVLQVAYPAIILSGVTGDGPHMEGGALLYAFGVVVVMLALLMLAAFLIPRILHYGKAEKGIVNVMVVFTNIGFMGVPHGGCYLWKGSAHLYDGSSHSLQPALFLLCH